LIVSRKWFAIFFKIFLLALLITLSACATVKKPLTGYIPGKEVDTLQSAVSISVKSGEHTTSGRGYLIFKEPDRFHLAVLSPFGATLLEVFSDSERLTCLLPSKQTAYSGLFTELPPTSVLQSIGLLRWVVAHQPHEAPAGAREFTASTGDRFFYAENGLVERKVSAEGDQVTYHDYMNANSVAFPESLVVTNRYGASVKVVFDDPDVNLPVEDDLLAPNLAGYHVLPLSDFKGL